jgi:tripartite-type tricarboxylate transporter receptor subunit TctC
MRSANNDWLTASGPAADAPRRHQAPTEESDGGGVEESALVLHVLTDAKMQERLADLGTTMFRGSPAELGMFIVEETEKWAKVVKFSGARPE